MADDDQYQAMLALSSAQTAQLPLLLALVKPAEQIPRADFEAYFASARRYLTQLVTFDQRWPTVVDVPGAVRPLVQQLGICADAAQGRGERADADRLRAEADDLGARYLTGEAAAELRRDRAMQSAVNGRFPEALDGLDAAQAGYAAAGNRIQAAQTLTQLANVLEWLGDYERALDRLAAAEAAVAPDLAGGPPSDQDVSRAIAEQLAAISRGEDAAGRVGETALGLRRIFVEILQARARINRWLGNWDQARQLFHQVRDAVEEVVPGGVDFHLAAIAVAAGDLELADQLVARIEPLFAGPQLRPRRASLRIIQADLAQRRGRPADALGLVADGLGDQATYPDLDLQWKLSWRRGRALAALGRDGEAVAAYRDAATAADTLRVAPLGYHLDTTALQDKLPMMHEGLDLALATGDGAGVVWFAELVKARALSALIAHPLSAAPPAGGAVTRPEPDPYELAFDQTSTRIDALAFAMYAGTATSDQLAEREGLIRRRSETLERIRFRDPRWRSVTEPAAIDVPAIAALLGRTGRIALVLHARGPLLVSALVSGDGVVAGQRTLTDEVLAGLQDYSGNLQRVSPDWFLADLSTERGIGLDDLLAPEVASALTARLDGATLLVVPHGVFHLLPWAAMTFGEHRLVEQAPVGVLPNLAALTLLDDEPAAPSGVVLFGDPDYTGLSRYPALPQAGAELDDLEQLYGPAVLSPTQRGSAATQDALVAVLDRPAAAAAVLHVACHATLDAKEPLASGLVLTGSTLDAAELVRRRCGFHDVVLSACSTGWRPQAADDLALVGDDALGLVASFLEAGARSLVVSIPQAKDDVARTFSLAWHRHRRSGASTLAAHRAAALELLASDPDNVWTWAGITGYGCR